MKLLANWLIEALILLLTTYLVPGFRIESLGIALFVVIVLSVLNILVKPLLIILTLPINIITLGLFTFVINALLLMLASSLIRGFHIDSFGTALLAAFVIAVLSWLIPRLFRLS
jgi:putative membrane protein